MSKPTEEEMDEVLNWCADSDDEGQSNFSGMTYEQGVSAAIRWIREDGERPDAE